MHYDHQTVQIILDGPWIHLCFCPSIPPHSAIISTANTSKALLRSQERPPLVHGANFYLINHSSTIDCQSIICLHPYFQEEVNERMNLTIVEIHHSPGW